MDIPKENLKKLQRILDSQREEEDKRLLEDKAKDIHWGWSQGIQGKQRLAGLEDSQDKDWTVRVDKGFVAAEAAPGVGKATSAVVVAEGSLVAAAVVVGRWRR